MQFENGKIYTKEEVLAVLASEKALFGDAAEKFVADTVASIPAATRDQYSEDMYTAFMAYYSAMSPATPNPAAQPTQTESKPAEKKVRKNANAVRLSASEVQVGRVSIDRTMQERTANMHATTVHQLCIDRPSPSEYIPADTTIIPKCTPEKLQEYEANLVPGEENRKNFDTLKAAVQNGTQVKARIGTNAYKVIGVQIEHPSEEANQQRITEYMSMDKLMGYMITKVPGFIESRKRSGIAVRIRWNQSNAKNSSNEYAEGSPSVMFVGKKDIIASNQYVCTSKVKTSQQEPDGVKIEQNLRTELSFKVYTKPDSQGTRGQRTVRLTGRAMIFDLERASDEFQNIFGNIGSSAQQELPTGADLEKLTSSVANTIAWMAQKNAGSRYGVEDFMTQIKETSGSNATSPDQDVDLG